MVFPAALAGLRCEMVDGGTVVVVVVEVVVVVDVVGEGRNTTTLKVAWWWGQRIVTLEVPGFRRCSAGSKACLTSNVVAAM
jgi:hypothetical protein